MRALQQQTARQLDRAGEVEFVADGDRATVTLRAVEDESGSVIYDLTIAVGGSEPVTLLQGDADADRTAGTWQVLRDGEAVVDVDWTHDQQEELLVVNRTVRGANGDRSSRFTATPELVALSFTGPNHDATAQWDRTNLEGEITVDDRTQCFQASDDAVDFCTVPCAEQ